MCTSNNVQQSEKFLIEILTQGCNHLVVELYGTWCPITKEEKFIGPSTDKSPTIPHEVFLSGPYRKLEIIF